MCWCLLGSPWSFSEIHWPCAPHPKVLGAVFVLLLVFKRQNLDKSIKYRVTLSADKENVNGYEKQPEIGVGLCPNTFTFSILSNEREREEVLRGPKQSRAGSRHMLCITSHLLGLSSGDVSKKIQNPIHSLSLLM